MGLVPSSSKGGGGGGGTVTSVTAGDTSIVVGGTATDPTIETGTLDKIAADHPPVAAVAMNGQKITGGAAGTAATDFAIVEQLPGTEIGYDQITVGGAITSTSEAACTTIITAGPHTFDGAPVICQVSLPAIAGPGAAGSNFVIVTLFEGAVEIGQLGTLFLNQPAGIQGEVPFQGWLRFQPSAGVHTYTVGAFASSTTANPTFSAGAGGTGVSLPAFCRFTKV